MARTELDPNECRVLGVMIEKAQTTPAQYPLTLNGLTIGCNQKNNRDPLTDLTEDAVIEAVEGLITKGLARQVILAGSRVNKFRHIAREALEISTAELVVMAELMLRGPQSVGELRGRAARMMPPGDQALSSIESTQQVLDALMSRAEPFIRRLGRRPGERAERFAQLLCPDLHPLDGPIEGGSGESEPSHRGGGGSGGGSDLLARVKQLESEVTMLKEAVARLSGM